MEAVEMTRRSAVHWRKSSGWESVDDVEVAAGALRAAAERAAMASAKTWWSQPTTVILWPAGRGIRGEDGGQRPVRISGPLVSSMIATWW